MAKAALAVHRKGVWPEVLYGLWDPECPCQRLCGFNGESINPSESIHHHVHVHNRIDRGSTKEAPLSLPGASD